MATEAEKQIIELLTQIRDLQKENREQYQDYLEKSKKTVEGYEGFIKRVEGRSRKAMKIVYICIAGIVILLLLQMFINR